MSKMSWQEKVKQVEIIHQSHCRESDKWRVIDTARELNRAVGAVSEDLQLAKALRTKRVDGSLEFPRLEKFRTVSEAIDYLKARKKEEKQGLDGK